MTKLSFLSQSIAFITIFATACSDDDLSWKTEIANIKEEIAAQNELINTLKKSVTVSNIEQADNSYTITFSDGTAVKLTNGITPIITIGDNYHWFINGQDTGVSAKASDGNDGSDGETPIIEIDDEGFWIVNGENTGILAKGTNGSNGVDGSDGETPTIEIDDEGFWVINGENTGILARGTNGADGVDGSDGETPTIEINADGYWVVNGKNTGILAQAQLTDADGKTIKQIVCTDANCTFYLTDGTSVTLLFDHVIVFWGDSLTASAGGGGTTMPNVVGKLLGGDYIIKNQGVGGERSTAICARQGGMPVTLSEDIILPADGSPVDVKDKLVNYFGTVVQLRSQSAVNNCTLNGIECKMTISISNNVWTIQRVNVGEKDELIKAGIPLITKPMRTLRTPYAMVIWIGQNGGWESSADLAQQIQRMVDYAGVSRFLVIGLHDIGNYTSSKVLQQTFGAKFIDWRQYAITYALDDAGIEPTEEDIAMSDHRIPASLRADKVHLNAAGYTVLGKLIYKRMVELGYVE